MIKALSLYALNVNTHEIQERHPSSHSPNLIIKILLRFSSINTYFRSSTSSNEYELIVYLKCVILLFMAILNKLQTYFWYCQVRWPFYFIRNLHLYIYAHSQNNFKQCPYISIILSILFLSVHYLKHNLQNTYYNEYIKNMSVLFTTLNKSPVLISMSILCMHGHRPSLYSKNRAHCFI